MDTTITSLMASADRGDRSATEALFTALYAELHRLARRELARSPGPVTLGATTLLHESYLSICKREGVAFADRARFMGYAARVMRGLIIDYARMRQAQKRGGLFEITSVGTDIAGPQTSPDDLLRIGEALEELMAVEPALAQLVDLKFFCGLSVAEIATLRGVSERTVKRQWERARTFLHATLQGMPPLE